MHFVATVRGIADRNALATKQAALFKRVVIGNELSVPVGILGRKFVRFIDPLLFGFFSLFRIYD